MAPATSTTATEVPAEPEQAPSSTIATEVPAEPEQAPSSSPGCSDVLRRPPSFEEGIADHELWIGRLADGAIADQRLLGVGYSVADGLLIDQEVHVWAMAASDHVLHHGIVNQAGFTDYGPISVDGEEVVGGPVSEWSERVRLGGEKLAADYGVPFLGKLPIDPRIGACRCGRGGSPPLLGLRAVGSPIACHLPGLAYDSSLL